MTWPLPAAFFLALLAIVLVVIDANELDYNWATNATGSVEWAVTGFMLLVTAAFALGTAGAAVYTRRGFFNVERFSGLTAVTWFGFFTAAAWVPAFFTVYLVPHIS